MKQTIEFLQSFVVIALVMTGLAGLSFSAVRDDGWLVSLLGNFLEAQVRYPMIAIPLTIAAIYLGYLWRNNEVLKGRDSKIPTFILYGFMAAGVYYVGHYIVTGTF